MLYKKRDKVQGPYDVIVIGSGLGGMTAANKLAKNGRKVLLLEAHNKLGGLATWFKRRQGDHIFDVSLHGFPYGMVKTCRKYWTKEIAGKIEKLEQVRFINPQYEVSSDFTKEDFTRILIEKFELSPEKVHGFFDELASMNFYDASDMTNGELFEKFFPGRNDVTRFLLEPIVYANGSTLEDPAITYGIVFSNFMSKGVYIYKGGTDELIGLMKEEMLSNGVDIKLHTKIDKIVVENSRVCGVEIDGEVVSCSSVVSNANLVNTVEKMVGEEHFSSEYLEKFKKVRLNTSSCQVYMGIKKGEKIPFVGDLIFYSEDPEFSTDNLLSDKIGSQTFSVYYPDNRPQSDVERYTIVSSSNARYEDWSNLSPEEYAAKKEYVTQRALDCIEKLIPGVKDIIDYVDCATPLTVEKYTHHRHGASFGTKFEGLDVSMKMQEQVSGLYHAGSVGIIMSGWLGTANYGVIQSHEVDTYLSGLEKESGSIFKGESCEQPSI